MSGRLRSSMACWLLRLLRRSIPPRAQPQSRDNEVEKNVQLKFIQYI